MTISKEQLSNAFAVATGLNPSADIREISNVVPHLVLNNDSNAAHILGTMLSANRYDWMAENMALLMTDGLTSHAKSRMLNTIYEPRHKISPMQVETLSEATSTVGKLTFSFPLWRFICQGFGDDRKALLEHYGFWKLKRDNDVRDESLPFSNPERDEFGTGFIWSRGITTVEYRRAYIACSIQDDHRPVTLVVRNSSYFFGRDRLPQPAYISMKRQTPNNICDLTLDDLEGPNSEYVPLQDVLRMPAIPSLHARVQAVSRITKAFEDFDQEFNAWLLDEGCDHLKNFLASTYEKHQSAGKKGAPLYLGRVSNDLPAWSPIDPVALDKDVLEKLDDILEIEDTKSRFALLSGPHGDFPLGPKYSKELAQKAPKP